MLEDKELIALARSAAESAGLMSGDEMLPADSLTIAVLVTSLEESLGRSLPPSALLSSNFSSLASIADMLRRFSARPK